MRQSIKKQVKKAFTLVEILIVVVILGILAAIVIPQFASATRDSQAGNLATQISTLQRQVELFMSKNQNRHPFQDIGGATWANSGADGGWMFLMGDANADGTISTAELANALVKDAPANPAWQDAGIPQNRVGVVSTAGTTGSASLAWVWNTNNRTLYASFYNEANQTVTDTATD